MVSSKYRRLCWLRYNGKIFETKCYISRCQEKINVYEFEAGHVLSRSDGGRDDQVQNLRPICFFCNRDMGKMHMKDYDLKDCDPKKREEILKKYDRRRTRNPIVNDNYIELKEDSDEEEYQFDEDEEYTQDEMLKEIQQCEKDLNKLKIQYNILYGDENKDENKSFEPRPLETSKIVIKEEKKNTLSDYEFSCCCRIS